MLREPWMKHLNPMFGALYDVRDADFNNVAEAKILEVARLIAAAPELLQACKTAVDALGCDRNRHDRLEAQQIIHVAVKKATGK